ncbi:MAG: GNAT family N-acetyltransferase [Planctomycetales bacterium]
MSEFLVRAARLDDRETIVEFNCRLAEETEGLRLDRATVTAGVEAVLADVSKGRYFVACRKDREQPVGQLMHTREWSDWRNGDLWWLQSVYVVPDCRRLGVFRLLYDHALEAARGAPQVVGVRLYVEQHNAAAQDAYRRLGMREAGYLVMERIFREQGVEKEDRHSQ